MRKFALVIHGGAGVVERHRMAPPEEQAYLAGLTEALHRGFGILRGGGTGLDAVQAAVEVLEDSPLFNAGRGAVFTSAGTNELEASIMDGHTLEAGAVTGVKRIKNPVALARLIMDRSPHVMLTGEGAEAFAVAQGMPLVPEAYFYTERRWQSLQRTKQTEQVSSADRHGTVGAVALDVHGRLAAATSTGGLTNKWPGRVGDSPVIGAGTYANDRCAVSATGHGEFFLRHAVAHDICARIEYKGQSLAAAAEDVVIRKFGAQGIEGGIVAITAAGEIAMPFAAEGMFRGVISSDGTELVRIYAD